jgi:hypothetical protein
MTRRADTILQILAEGRTLQQRVMIVVAHPDDEKIGMRTQLCHCAMPCCCRPPTVRRTTGIPITTRALLSCGPPAG